MKTIGRIGSESEYTIFSKSSTFHQFVHQGVLYEHDPLNGRCYCLDEPRIGREKGLARRRISAALFARLLKECEEMIAEAEKRGAA